MGSKRDSFQDDRAVKRSRANGKWQMAKGESRMQIGLNFHQHSRGVFDDLFNAF